MQASTFAAYIRSHPGVSPADAAKDLGVSVRTVRTYVRRANESMDGFASIALTRGSGYHLDVIDCEHLDSWLQDASGTTRDENVPQAPRDRVSYLINDLLMRTDWITIEELSRILFVSRATVSNDLKKVDQVLDPYGLTIEKRPHYGIRITGPEMARRVCLAHNISDAMDAASEHDHASTHTPAHAAGGLSVQETVPPHELSSSGQTTSRGGVLQGRVIANLIETVSSCVERAAHESGYKISSYAYQGLLIHIAVALVRVEEGCYLPAEGAHLEHLKTTGEYAVAQRVAEELSRSTGVQLPEEEIGYIAIHLAGKQTIDALPEGDGGSLVISEEVWDIVSQMLECVRSVYHLDFRDDLELRMNLACHIVPMDVRLRYHLHLKNPLLSDIKQQYPLAWSIATDACSVLSQRHGTAPGEDELGYITLLFELALERSKGEASKKTILVVCASGAGSARLLEHRVREEFGDCIDKVVTCDVLSLPTVDFADIDYVFTTVPIARQLPVPVREVKYFFDAADAEDLREALRSDVQEHVDLGRYFAEDLFFAHLRLSTKAVALDFMLDRVCERRAVAPNFRELVWKREAAVATSFGNGVAMPHPLEVQQGETFIAVGLLEEPVVWDDQGHTIQAIFLCSFAEADGDADGDELHTFLDRLTDMLMSRRAMRTLTADQSWESLSALIETFSSRSERGEDAGARLSRHVPAGEYPGAAQPDEPRNGDGVRQGGERDGR